MAYRGERGNVRGHAINRYPQQQIESKRKSNGGIERWPCKFMRGDTTEIILNEGPKRPARVAVLLETNPYSLHGGRNRQGVGRSRVLLVKKWSRGNGVPEEVTFVEVDKARKENCKEIFAAYPSVLESLLSSIQKNRGGIAMRIQEGLESAIPGM